MLWSWFTGIWMLGQKGRWKHGRFNPGNLFMDVFYSKDYAEKPAGDCDYHPFDLWDAGMD